MNQLKFKTKNQKKRLNWPSLPSSAYHPVVYLLYPEEVHLDVYRHHQHDRIQCTTLEWYVSVVEVRSIQCVCPIRLPNSQDLHNLPGSDDQSWRRETHTKSVKNKTMSKEDGILQRLGSLQGVQKKLHLCTNKLKDLRLHEEYLYTSLSHCSFCPTKKKEKWHKINDKEREPKKTYLQHGYNTSEFSNKLNMTRIPSIWTRVPCRVILVDKMVPTNIHALSNQKKKSQTGPNGSRHQSYLY